MPTTKSNRKPALKAAGAKDNGTNYTIRPKATLEASPAGTLGFSSLVTPDDKFADAATGKVPTFNVKLHMTEEAIQRFGEKLDLMMDQLVPKLEAEITKKGGKIALPIKRISGASWLERVMKLPSEKSKVQTPFIGFSAKSSIPTKDGGMEAITMKAWDRTNKELDLPSLNIGMGSVVQVMYTPGVFAGPYTEDKSVKRRAGAPMICAAEPTLRLIGVRVLKLEQRGGSVGRAKDLDEADLIGLDDDFEADDLAAFAMGSPSKPPKAPPHEDDHEEAPATDIDDPEEISF